MRKRPNPDSEPNIKRIDTKPRAKKQTHGFQVHFLRGTNVVTKMFSDAVYGGKEGARKAARKHRRSVLGDLPERSFRGLASVNTKKSSAKKKPAKKSKRH